jgi:glycosyltransferase involved in cell wall biosynthesis
MTEPALISIVVPAFNESAGIQTTIRTLATVMLGTGHPSEILVVDDGSRDGTYDRAAEVAIDGVAVRAFRLSRNFGKEAALLAGLRQARGAAVITIDADLQHPPSLIPAMIEGWRQGAQVVHGIKRDRGEESWFATTRAKIVNGLLTRLGEIDLQKASDYKLLDRAAVDVLTLSMPERNRLYRGLASWIGFPQISLEFDVAPRQTGQSAWSLRALLGLTLTAMVSFTSTPLRIVTVMGMLTFALGFAIGTEALWVWAHGRSASGFTTVIITLLLIGSFIMVSLGIIGEYIAKIYEEVKRRPEFIIDRSHENS